MSTDPYTVCTTGPNLGRKLGTNCGCGVDNESCPQPPPIHPRVIPDPSPGRHALRTGKTGEIHSFHRTYYYPCSSSRKFLFKTGCVDKSRVTAGPIRARTETARAGTGTESRRERTPGARGSTAANPRRGMDASERFRRRCSQRTRVRSASPRLLDRVGRRRTRLSTAIRGDDCGQGEKRQFLRNHPQLFPPLLALPCWCGPRGRIVAAGLSRPRTEGLSCTRRGSRSGSAKRGTV